ncbi:MAG: T9SS type A sorting domain-containing protein [Ignavibacteria bacterium]
MICFSGGPNGVVGINNLSSIVPDKYSLSQNYPNPFNPTTNVEFGIAELGFVTLKIYDGLGREVQTLVNGNLSPGNYKVDFDGSNFASGIYYYKLEAGNFVETKRMMLLK